MPGRRRPVRHDSVWPICVSRSCGKTRIILKIVAIIDALPFSVWPKWALKSWIRRSSRPSTVPPPISPSPMLSSCESYNQQFSVFHPLIEFVIHDFFLSQQFFSPAGFQTETGSLFVHAARRFVDRVDSSQTSKVTALVHFTDSWSQVIGHPEGCLQSQKQRHVRWTKCIFKKCIVDILCAAVGVDDSPIYLNIYFVSLRFSGPKFDLVATATLALDEVNDSVKSHDLILENLGKEKKVQITKDFLKDSIFITLLF